MTVCPGHFRMQPLSLLSPRSILNRGGVQKQRSVEHSLLQLRRPAWRNLYQHGQCLVVPRVKMIHTNGHDREVVLVSYNWGGQFQICPSYRKRRGGRYQNERLSERRAI